VTNEIRRVYGIEKGLSPAGSLAAVPDVVGDALEQAPLATEK
jgi:hypothetical protein